jgi:hypothetical protein
MIKYVKKIKGQLDNKEFPSNPVLYLVYDLCNFAIIQYAEIKRLKKRIKNLKEWDR